jgi:hypothetical protein
LICYIGAGDPVLIWSWSGLIWQDANPVPILEKALVAELVDALP